MTPPLNDRYRSRASRDNAQEHTTDRLFRRWAERLRTLKT